MPSVSQIINTMRQTRLSHIVNRVSWRLWEPFSIGSGVMRSATTPSQQDVRPK